MDYISQYRQVSLLREIENRFGASNYLHNPNSDLITVPATATTTSVPGSPLSKSKSSGKAIPLAMVKRAKPVPPVGYYEDVADTYIRTTMPKVKGLASLSSDKLPKFIFKPKELHPEPTDDLVEFQ